MILLTAGKFCFMNRPILPLIVLGICTVCLIGCGSSDDSLMVREGHLVKVFYDEKPIGGVEVRLYNVSYVDGDEPAYVGFSDPSGSAYLTPLGENSPAIDSMQWKVAVLSDGDGSWMIDPKYNDPAKAAMEIQFGGDDSSADSSPTIRLPSGAIRSMAR